MISPSFAHIGVGIPRIGRFTISGEQRYFPRSNPRDVPECRKWFNWADSRWPRLSCSGNQTITKRSHLFRRIMCETGSSCFSSVEFSHERATIEGADLSLLHRHPWSIPSFQLILFFPLCKRHCRFTCDKRRNVIRVETSMKPCWVKHNERYLHL